MTKEFERYIEENGTFTQSLLWAKVKSTWKSEYVISKDASGNIRGAILILIKKLPIIGSTLIYAPKGPICDTRNVEILEDLMSQVKTLAIRYNAFFLKIDPMIDENDEISKNNLSSLGFIPHYDKVGFDNVQSREN